MLFVLLALEVSFAAAGPCTGACPKLSDGLYCPVNDVTEHADVNRDVKLIKELLSAGDYAAAKDVYTSGNFSSKGLGEMRTLQDLAQKDMTSGGKYTNVFYSGALALYGSINAVWHDPIIACLDNASFCAGKSDDFRQYIINKGLIGVVTAYVTYEMGAAVWKAEQGQLEDTNAAYAWDEAAAFYVGNIAAVIGDGYTGSAPGNLYSPYEFNWKRDSDFPDGISTHTEAIPLLNFGLMNVRGSYNAPNVQAAQLAMYKILSIAAIRSAIKYGWKAYGDGSFQEKYLAEGWAYWRSASGYISTVNRTAVEQVDAIFDLSQTSFTADAACKVKNLVESMYADLGITCAMVGKWKDAPTGGCLDSVCQDAVNMSLPDGSTTYADTCEAKEISNAPSASSFALLLVAAAGMVALG